MTDLEGFESSFFSNKCDLGTDVCLFGGTFDPIHTGHLIAAETCRSRLGLDEVLFVVAKDPWQKTSTSSITSFADRLAMVDLAIGGVASFLSCDIELAIEGSSTTFKTLSVLQQLYPETRFRVLLGADAAAGLNEWQDFNQLAAIAELVVANRPGTTHVDLSGWSATSLEIPATDISSSDIRQFVIDNESVRFQTPIEVAGYIESRGLYTDMSERP